MIVLLLHVAYNVNVRMQAFAWKLRTERIWALCVQKFARH